MLLGFSPKFGALIHTIPAAVIGGASIVVFGLIAVAGARIWVQNSVDLSQNGNLIMVAVTLVLGAGDFALTLGGFYVGRDRYSHLWRDFTQCVVKQKVG